MSPRRFGPSQVETASHTAESSHGGHGLRRDTLVYGIGGAAAQIINVAFLPIFTRIFSTSEFGALDFLLTLASMAMLFAQAGLNSALFYFYRREERAGDQRRVAATALALVAAFGLVLAVIGIIAAGPIATALLLTDAYAPTVALAFAWVPINLVGSLALDLLRLEFRPVAYSILGLGRTLLASIVGAILAGPMGYGVAGLLAAYVAIGLVGTAATLWLTRASWGRGFEAGAATRMLRFGLPLVPTGVAYWIIAYSDRYFIIQILGISAAGVYGVANRVALGVQMVIYAFEAAWWPFAYARAREPGHREHFARIFSMVTIATLVLAVLLGLFAREILLIVTTPQFVAAYPYVGILALALVVHGAYGIVSIGVQLGERTKHMAWTSGVAAIANIALNILLIPWLGILGASLATLAAYAMSTVLLFAIAQQGYRIPYYLRPTGVALLGGIAVLLAGLFMDAQVRGNTWDPGVTGLKIAIVAGCVIAAMTSGRVSLRGVMTNLRGQFS